MSPALRLRIPQPINSFKRSSTQSVRPTPQRLGPRTRPGLRRRVGADSRWGYNRWQIQLLLILGDSGKEVLGDSLRSISRQERQTCAEHPSQRLPSRPHPPSDRRSEEQTYEIQSLMRRTYADLCFEKKTHTK